MFYSSKINQWDSKLNPTLKRISTILNLIPDEISRLKIKQEKEGTQFDISDLLRWKKMI